MRALVEENQKLREALRMDNKMPIDSLRLQNSTDTGMLDKLRDLGDLNQTQREEMNRLRTEHEEMAGKLSKSEINVDRKLEMLQILRAQLDDADQKGNGVGEERMRLQETLMSSQVGLDKAQRDLEQLRNQVDEERVLKEDAWERLLNVDPNKTIQLESKLEEERMNAKEMMRELRALRAEKDAAASEAAHVINALTEKVQRSQSTSDIEQQGLRGAVDALQHERVDALEKLQNMRQDYATLDSQVHLSKTDNQALMAQLKFLTLQLQARQPTESVTTPSSILKNNTPHSVQRSALSALPPMPSYNEDDHESDMQARFYEQQILRQQTPVKVAGIMSPSAPQPPTVHAVQQVPPHSARQMPSQPIFSPHQMPVHMVPHAGSMQPQPQPPQPHSLQQPHPLQQQQLQPQQQPPPPSMQPQQQALMMPRLKSVMHQATAPITPTPILNMQPQMVITPQ